MDPERIVRENWLTRKPSPRALDASVGFSAFVVFTASLYLQGTWGADHWMPASRVAVFEHGEYWRAWTTLFAHADMAHLAGNLLLLVPLAYFLSGHFGILFFPTIGLLLGGLVNLLVLLTMKSTVYLVGISGVVYWMAGAWLTLLFLIDRRQGLRYRIGRAACIVAALLVPDSYRPEVSYLSHLLGAAFGVGSGLILYLLQRRVFASAEVVEWVDPTLT